MREAKILAAAALLTTLSLAPAARSENLEHTRQLLATKQCPRCDLAGAGLVFASLAGANLNGANLSRANLSRADLAGADLAGADLRNASLYGVNLAGANLKGANLSGVDLRDANLAGADITGIILTNANVKGTIGLGDYIGQLENLYQWAMDEGQRKNYAGAISYFNQALAIKPDFAPAYLGRAAARSEMGDYAGGLEDANYAATLFNSQGNRNGYQTSQNMAQRIQAYQEKAQGGNRGGGGGSLINILGSLLQLFF